MSEPLRQRASDDGGMKRDLEFPPVPEPLRVGVYDNHTHLEIADGENPLPVEENLRRASEVGLLGVVQVGTDLETSRWSADLAGRDPRVLAAVAIHPNEAPRLAERGLLQDHLAGIAELAARPRVRAVGETGLDFFRTGTDGHAAQFESFEAHIEIAKANNIAMQIHDRDAHDDVVSTLNRVGAPAATVFHCFSGDVELAKLCAQNGWYLSFSGTVTFKNSQGLRDALAIAPRELILVETDAPFLTPIPYRGRPNGSYLVPLTMRFMAETLQTDLDELCGQVARNTEAVYGQW